MRECTTRCAAENFFANFSPQRNSTDSAEIELIYTVRRHVAWIITNHFFYTSSAKLAVASSESLNFIQRISSERIAVVSRNFDNATGRVNRVTETRVSRRGDARALNTKRRGVSSAVNFHCVRAREHAKCPGIIPEFRRLLAQVSNFVEPSEARTWTRDRGLFFLSLTTATKHSSDKEGTFHFWPG